MKEKRKKYATIFFTCLYLSSFTFGGGLVIVPMMRKKFVDDLKWLEEKEMMDLTAIAQSSPGAIVVNAAILLGYKIGGVFGSLLAILGTIIPPMTIIAVVSVFYELFRTNAVVNAMLSGMQAGVAAVICDVVVSMFLGEAKGKKILPIVIMLLSFSLTYFLKVNVVYIILACILWSVAVFFVRRAREKKPKGETKK